MPSCFLYTGDQLGRGERLTALNEDYRFVHQFDGNVVLYKTHGAVVKWASNTAGKTTTHLKLEKSGKLILYNDSMKVWELDEKTVIRHHHGPPNAFILQDNGQVGLHDKDLHYLGGLGEGASLTDTSYDHSKIPLGGSFPMGGSIFVPGRTAFINFTIDGDIQFSAHDDEPKPFGIKNATIMCMQDDGNFVLYDSTAKPVYDFKCSGSGAKAAMILGNGDLVLVDDDTVAPANAEGHIIKTLVKYSSL